MNSTDSIGATAMIGDGGCVDKPSSSTTSSSTMTTNVGYKRKVKSKRPPLTAVSVKLENSAEEEQNY